MPLTSHSEFSKYLSTVAIDRSSVDKYTHISMDGFCHGLFKISDDKAFQDAYISAIIKGGSYYLCEMRTSIFHMFLDLDFTLKDPSVYFTTEQKTMILTLIQTTISLFYPTNTKHKTLQLIVCDVKENNNMHIYMPNLQVNEEQAIIMANAVGTKLQSIMGDMNGILVDNWFKIVDTSVYLKNGLRLVGSRKCKTCPICKARKKNNICAECGSIGKIDVGRVYNISTVITNGMVDNKTLSTISSSYGALIIKTTIRCNHGQALTVGWRKYIGCPTLDTSRLKRPRPTDTDIEPSKRWDLMMRQNAKSHDLSEYTEDKKAETVQKSLSIIIAPATKIYKLCVHIIRRYASVYQYVEIREIRTTKKKQYYRITVRGEGSNFCNNLQKKEHKSNSIYFIIKPSGATQKCWCRCNVTEGRKYGLCSQYSSTPKPLYTKETSVLFPLTKQHDVSFGYIPRSSDMQNLTQVQRVRHRLYMKAHIK
jgi:hypothetical protein